MNIFDKRLMECYRSSPLRYKLYTFIRYAICPFKEIEKYAPASGRILDCGCGHGIFANILAMGSAERQVIGVDMNEEKIAVASAASGRKNIEFRAGDMEKGLSENNIACFFIIDVMTYVPLDAKVEFFKRLYDNMKRGQRLVIKCMWEKPRWKSLAILFHMQTVDKLMHKGLKDNAYFMSKDAFTGLLQSTGFKVEFRDIGRGYLYPHCLYICDKG